MTHGGAVIVGAGPAGLMAADVLSQAGLRVTIYERMPTPARKLLMAGRGGLNITHSEDLENFLNRYGPARGRLEPAIRAFSPSAVQTWCKGFGQDTFVGSSGRIFPQSFKASPLLRAWLRRLESHGVSILTRHDWLGFGTDDALLFNGPDGALTLKPDVALFALGGASWPRLGADGSWVAHFAARDVAVVPLEPANCGFTVKWSSDFVERFAGTPLKGARFAHKDHTLQGEAMITAAGIEGSAIYALSRPLRETLCADGAAELIIDLKPHDDLASLAGRLSRPRGKQSLANHLRRAGFDTLSVHLMREATGNRLPADAQDLARLAKALPLHLQGTSGLQRAISTAGGIAFDAIDEQFMLKQMPGYFVAGEMLDWEAPTGGYLLQACLATGAQAARGMIRYLEAR